MITDPTLPPIIAFDILQVLGLILMSASLCTVWFSSRVQRSTAWFSCTFSWGLTCIGYLLIIRHQTGPFPGSILCLCQAMLIYAFPALFVWLSAINFWSLKFAHRNALAFTTLTLEASISYPKSEWSITDPCLLRSFSRYPTTGPYQDLQWWPWVPPRLDIPLVSDRLVVIFPPIWRFCWYPYHGFYCKCNKVHKYQYEASEFLLSLAVSIQRPFSELPLECSVVCQLGYRMSRRGKKRPYIHCWVLQVISLMGYCHLLYGYIHNLRRWGGTI